jgi:hypothetical protein
LLCFVTRKLSVSFHAPLPDDWHDLPSLACDGVFSFFFVWGQAACRTSHLLHAPAWVCVPPLQHPPHGVPLPVALCTDATLWPEWSRAMPAWNAQRLDTASGSRIQGRHTGSSRPALHWEPLGEVAGPAGQICGLLAEKPGVNTAHTSVPQLTNPNPFSWRSEAGMQQAWLSAEEPPLGTTCCG